MFTHRMKASHARENAQCGRKDRRFIEKEQTQVTGLRVGASVFAARRTLLQKCRLTLISSALILSTGFFQCFAFLTRQAGFAFAADLF